MLPAEYNSTLELLLISVTPELSLVVSCVNQGVRKVQLKTMISNFLEELHKEERIHQVNNTCQNGPPGQCTSSKDPFKGFATTHWISSMTFSIMIQPHTTSGNQMSITPQQHTL